MDMYMAEWTECDFTGIAFEIVVRDLCDDQACPFRFIRAVRFDGRRNVNVPNAIGTWLNAN